MKNIPHNRSESTFSFSETQSLYDRAINVMPAPPLPKRDYSPDKIEEVEEYDTLDYLARPESYSARRE